MKTFIIPIPDWDSRIRDVEKLLIGSKSIEASNRAVTRRNSRKKWSLHVIVAQFIAKEIISRGFHSWLRDGILSGSRISIAEIRDRHFLFWARTKNPEIPGIWIGILKPLKIPKKPECKIPKIPKSRGSGSNPEIIPSEKSRKFQKKIRKHEL